MLIPVLAESYEARLSQVASCPLDASLEQLLQALVQAPPASGPPAIGGMAEALALWRLGRHSDALQRLNRLEEELSHDPRYWILRGMASKQHPDGAPAALQAYRRAIALDGARADLHYNLANLLKDSEPGAAEQAYRRSLQLDPSQSACWHNLGALLLGQQRLQHARQCLCNSLLLDPLAANVWCDLGNLYQAQDNLLAAKQAFTQAISLDRLHGPSHVNLGAALVQGLQPEQALVILQRGVELEKSSADSLWNLALAHLQLGDYEQGWPLYEARLHLRSAPPRQIPTAGPMPGMLNQCPRPGEPPLVVWSEQGIGDAIQFSRYLALLDAAGVPFEFRVRPSLLRLFQGWTGLGARVCEERSGTDASDVRPHIPLMSLPRLFRTTLATVPGALPYLRPSEPPPPELQVPQPPGGLAIGLVWASDAANAAMYRRKTIPLALLMPRLLQLLELDLIDLHCLQCGVDEVQLEPWQHHPRITNWAPRLGDFADTAHVVQQLDLVISVDTAVAHLAGALRRPTWLLLPHAADFRWLQQRDDSPWYPGTMRLFRQPAPGDWSGLVDQLHAAFDALFLLDLEALAAHKLA